MFYHCTLPLDINECRNLSADKKYCTAKNIKCSFCTIENGTVAQELPTHYVRQPRWYEKYYK